MDGSENRVEVLNDVLIYTCLKYGFSQRLRKLPKIKSLNKSARAANWTQHFRQSIMESICAPYCILKEKGNSYFAPDG